MTGAELEAIGVAHHRSGDYAAAMDAYERAHAEHLRAGDALGAARAARTVGWFRGWVFGDWAVHRGWLGRAGRVLATVPPGSRRDGWLLLDAAQTGCDLAVQREQYESVLDLARQCDDRDLECEANTSLGLMLVFSGLVGEGMAHLDEALVALCAGDIDELPVLEGCLCGLFNACERTRDVKRAEQWLRAAGDLIERRRLVAVAGYCRAHYAGILIAAGRWADAEAELARVIGSLPAGSAVHASARCRLGDLRVRQGRFEEAEIVLSGLDHHEDAVLPMAMLQVARGRADLGLELVERRLASPGIEDHVAAPLLAVAVEARLDLGELGEAQIASARLTELARTQTSAYVAALAALARGEHREAGTPGDGRADLHEAVSRFAEAGMPYEVARARLAVARSAASGRPGVAVAEAEAALATFRELGALHHVDATAALLRTLGAPTRSGRQQRGDVLTARERDVLDLLGHGLTNAELARRLYISPKTVEHHVGRILSKLGLRNRAEAAAHAARSGKPAEKRAE